MAIEHEGGRSMPDSKHTGSTITSGALAPDATSTADIAGLQEKLRIAGEIVAEVDNLSNIAALGIRDPETACDELVRYFDFHCASPPHLADLYDAMMDLMTRRADDAKARNRIGVAARAEVPSAVREAARCDDFRKAPSSYIPGAVHAERLAAIGGPASVDGFIDVGGVVSPWVFSASGVGKGGVFELGQAMIALGFDHGYIVGTYIRDGATIPANITYVEVK
ncbi:hypothetical protein [uncultured Methylobacterium sp.]|uniref:hypothetical protein n=1 Tax=uncultured Methylobacterium sp. TaxID=157278 RepID=UPI0035C9DAE7